MQTFGPWSPLSCMQERTQGRPEVTAPVAPPSSALPSRRLPGLARIGRHRGVSGGELLKFGRYSPAASARSRAMARSSAVT